MPEFSVPRPLTQQSSVAETSRQPRRERTRTNLTKHLLAGAAGHGVTGVPQSLVAEFGIPATVAPRLYHIVYIGRDRPTISKRFEDATQAEHLAREAENVGWVALIQHVELFPDENNPPARCTECGQPWDDQTDPVTGWCGECNAHELNAQRAQGVVL